jgi:HEAT repeat protein
MRNAALIALQTDERPRAVAWSIRLLEDKALVVRTQAVRNLIELNAREAEPILWQQIAAKRNFRGHESLWIRMHIAEALSRFAGQGRARQFRRLLMDNDERLHKWAIKGLENSTGMKLSSGKEPVDIQRQKWLARLGGDSI